MLTLTGKRFITPLMRNDMKDYTVTKKIIVGFVVQTFDNETKKCIHQEFVSGDDITYENDNGDTLDNHEELYFPLEMKQSEK
jgi:hypothetical protein